MVASPVSLFSPLVVQKVECVNLKWAAAQNGKFDRFEGVLRTIGNVTRSQQLCNVEIVFATRQPLLSLSLTVAKRSVQNVPFGALARRVIFHKVSLTSKLFFLATEFLFMTTILQLKVAKRRLFEKVSLERCKS